MNYISAHFDSFDHISVYFGNFGLHFDGFQLFLGCILVVLPGLSVYFGILGLHFACISLNFKHFGCMSVNYDLRQNWIFMYFGTIVMKLGCISVLETTPFRCISEHFGNPWIIFFALPCISACGTATFRCISVAFVCLLLGFGEFLFKSVHFVVLRY